MKKIVVILSLLVIVTMNLKAQSAAKSVYAEIGGPGLASVNFDIRFSPKEDGLGGRIGVGGFTESGFGIFTLPVGLNYLLGKDGKNYFEMGAGFTYVHTKGDIIFGDNGSSSSQSFGHLSIGYRLQPTKGGFLFRAAIVPVFGKGYFIPYYAGIAFGYKF